MAHYGTLRDNSLLDSQTENADDIRGATVYGGGDKTLGKIDDVIFDHATGNIHYVVIDTGGWLSSKKFIVPPQQLRSSAAHKDDFEINLTKDQIQKFPPYDDSAVESEGKWRDYESRYQDSWVGGAVQHQEGSDHNVTPTATEMPPEPGSIGSQISPEENARLTAERIIPAGADEVLINNSAVGIGSRWSNFEDRLRQRRRDITSQCETCRADSAPGTASDRERDELRKAS
ncbi:MAG: PRC-barrel domain-containing protein [Terriglobales bacterium]|jgi:sporulation protein YlmC with PRC-barrel domain|nr:PRC-barrel domain-containing protein [Terriglobales bacterium]